MYINDFMDYVDDDTTVWIQDMRGNYVAKATANTTLNDQLSELSIYSISTFANDILITISDF